MKIIKDKLLNDLMYPCPINEIKSYLKELPKEDLGGIKSIRLSNQKTDIEGGYLKDGRIEIFYIVDANYKKVINSYPDIELENKWKKFGGIIKIYNRKHCISWDLKSLKKYIKFVLFHEIGHHVYYKTYGKLDSGSQEELFCDNYAYKYLSGS